MDGGIDKDVAQVHYEYYRWRRRNKLIQIENALSGNCEKIFMSLGMDLNTVDAMNQVA